MLDMYVSVPSLAWNIGFRTVEYGTRVTTPNQIKMLNIPPNYFCSRLSSIVKPNGTSLYSDFVCFDPV